MKVLFEAKLKGEDKGEFLKKFIATHQEIISNETLNKLVSIFILISKEKYKFLSKEIEKSQEIVGKFELSELEQIVLPYHLNKQINIFSKENYYKFQKEVSSLPSMNPILEEEYFIVYLDYLSTFHFPQIIYYLKEEYLVVVRDKSTSTSYFNFNSLKIIFPSIKNIEEINIIGLRNIFILANNQFEIKEMFLDFLQCYFCKFFLYPNKPIILEITKNYFFGKEDELEEFVNQNLLKNESFSDLINKIQIINQDNIKEQGYSAIVIPYYENYEIEGNINQFEQGILKGEIDGVIGFENLGNTCFMNTGLQCLINSIPLSSYFLWKKFNANISSEIRIYQDFVKNYWLTKKTENFDIVASEVRSSTLIPQELKQIAGEYMEMYNGFNENDSVEFMNFFLNILHEKLNRISKKLSYNFRKEFGFLETLDAEMEWIYSKSRENSPISQIFNGQIYSQAICSQCYYHTLQFDQNMMWFANTYKKGEYLTLNFNLKVFELFEHVELFETKSKCIKYKIECPNTCSYEKISQLICKKNEILIWGIIKKGLITFKPLRRDLTISLNVIGPYKTKLQSNEKEPKEPKEPKPYEYVAYKQFCEYDIETCLINCVDIEIFSEGNKDFISNISKDLQMLILQDYPLILHLQKNQKVHDIKEAISKSLGIKENFELIQVQYSYINQSCIFVHEKNCKFLQTKICNCTVLDDNILINGLLHTSQYIKRRYISIKIIFQTKTNFDKFKIVKIEEGQPISLIKESDNQSIFLTNCIDLYSREMLLDEDSLINCPNCKSKVQIYKSVCTYRFPEIIILHIIRVKDFQTHSTNKVNNDNNEVELDASYSKENGPIYFPEILNTNEFSSFLNNSNKSGKYYLYAISNHSGSFSQGHYWAFCYNEPHKEWYKLNDEKTSKVNIKNENPSSSALTFYYRRIKN